MTVTTRAFSFDVAVCHLKSKLLSYGNGRFQPRDEGERARFGAYALYRRTAEATLVRSLADRLLKGDGREHGVVVLGDLNDEAPAATTQIPLGPPGSEIGTPGFDKPDKGDAKRLWNVAPLIPPEQRYSRIHAGRRELIDHILMSRSILNLVRAAGTGIPGSTATALPSVGDEDPAERRNATGSDHAPVWVRIER